MRRINRPRSTRTSTYVSSTSSSDGFDGDRFLHSLAPPPGAINIPRLGFLASPKRAYEIGKICTSLRNELTDAIVFCDTSFFDDRTAEPIWEALFIRDRRVVIIPPVLKELEPWLATHEGHIAADAVVNKHPSIEFGSFDGLTDIQKAALEYYVNLLAMRKRVFDWAAFGFREHYGRSPNQAEMTKLKERIHQQLGPRGYLMAKKGAEAAGSPNFLTDEILVCHAFMTAIWTGREVIILSKDEDIQEQFYKLLWLLDTHYRGMLLADRYAFDPLSFVTHLMPKTDPVIDEVFVREGSILLERSERMISEILPSRYTFVPVQCVVLGESLTTMVFGAEIEMARLLQIKGETEGLNTSSLDGKNCHLWLAPLDIPNRFRGCAVIAHDRRTKLGRSRIELPRFDIIQTIFSQERYLHTRFSNLAR